MDSAGEQKKLEARKLLENRAESSASDPCYVGRFVAPDSLIEKNVIAIHKV